MNVTGLDLLFLEVNRLEESLSFYHELLGCEVIKHTPESEPPLATLQAGSLKITLAQQLETMLRRGRGVNFFLGVTDVDEFYEEVRMKTETIDPPTDEGW